MGRARRAGRPRDGPHRGRHHGRLLRRDPRPLDRPHRDRARLQPAARPGRHGLHHLREGRRLVALRRRPLRTRHPRPLGSRHRPRLAQPRSPPRRHRARHLPGDDRAQRARLRRGQRPRPLAARDQLRLRRDEALHEQRHLRPRPPCRGVPQARPRERRRARPAGPHRPHPRRQRGPQLPRADGLPVRAGQRLPHLLPRRRRHRPEPA